MQTLLNLLEVNHTLVYFVYGQVFFSLGLAIAMHSRRHSQLDLAKQLSWLAAFGLVHGLHEWAHVFVPIQAAYLPASAIDLLNGARIGSLALSFFFLGQFGALVAISDFRLRLAVRLAFGVLLVIWLGWTMALASGSNAGAFVRAGAWARLIIGFPAASLAAAGMIRQAVFLRKVGLGPIGRDFCLAALSFGAYALLAGLVVPRQDPPTAQWPLYLLQTGSLGLPVLRSMAGLGMVLGIVRGLRVFEVETDRWREGVERARLETAQRARSAMEAMATTISEHRDLTRLLDAALEQALALAGSSKGCLFLAGRNGGRVELRAARGVRLAPERDMACRPRDRCSCRVTMEQGDAHVIPAGSQCQLRAEGPMAGSWASVPLMAHGRAVGVLRLADGDFSPEMLALLKSVGKQLGLAVENAELAREVAQKEAARAQLLKKVIAAQEEERRRVARELHDQTGQSLTAVIMALGAARERMNRAPRKVTAMLDDTRDLAVRALESTRDLIMGLRPAALDDLGLVPALRRFSEDLGRKGNVEIVVEAGGLARRLPGDVEVAMFRILQESLLNVSRHSQAKRATVRLTCPDGVVHAEVADDGLGFDLTEATARPESGRGLGLLGMRERAGLLGGQVVVQAEPGRGTRVLVDIPLGEDGDRG